MEQLNDEKKVLESKLELFTKEQHEFLKFKFFMEIQNELFGIIENLDKYKKNICENKTEFFNILDSFHYETRVKTTVQRPDIRKADIIKIQSKIDKLYESLQENKETNYSIYENINKKYEEIEKINSEIDNNYIQTGILKEINFDINDDKINDYLIMLDNQEELIRKQYNMVTVGLLNIINSLNNDIDSHSLKSVLFHDERIKVIKREIDILNKEYKDDNKYILKMEKIGIKKGNELLEKERESIAIINNKLEFQFRIIKRDFNVIKERDEFIKDQNKQLYTCYENILFKELL